MASESEAADSSISPACKLSLHCQKTAISPQIQNGSCHYQNGERQPFRLQLSIVLLYLSYEPIRAAPPDVITSSLIFRLSQDTLALQFLCVMGLCLGVAIVLRGIRLRPIRAHAPASRISISWKTNSPLPQQNERVSTRPVQEIIRLSSDPVLMKSVEMTQQQKIAAALARAGTSHSSARAHESASVAVEALEPDPSEQETPAVQEVHFAQSTPTPKFAGISHLLIWSGLALAVLSCYLLVTVH